MAQIIKHRRGSISQLKDVTAKVGELVMATGSINDLNGPFIFIGETENAAGGYRAVSKLYSGNAAPTISNVSYGTVLDGTPFYAAGDQTLYILSSGGNTAIDLTGNIEGNTISGVTINNLESTNVSASFFTGSFKGDGSNLTNIPASGVTGLNLSRIATGSYTASISEAGGFQVNTDTSITGAFNVSGASTLNGNVYTNDIHGAEGIYLKLHSDQYVQMQYDGPGNSSYVWLDENGISLEGNSSVTGSLTVNGDVSLTGSVTIDGNEYVNNIYSRNGNQFNGLHLNGGTFGAPEVELTSGDDISLFAEGGNINVTGSMKVNGNVTVEQDLYVSGNIYQTGSFYTQGNIVLSGSINIGDSLTGDTINFGGEVNSNILPTSGSTYDLGSSGKTWNNVWAETAHFTTLNLETIQLDSISLPGDLTVSGTTTLSGSVYVEDLIQGRVTFAGAGGQLVDNENFTYDLANGFLLNTSGSVNINTSGSFNLYTHDGDNIFVSSSSNLNLRAASDINLTAADDIRIDANDTFVLRNAGIGDSITLITEYGSGNEKQMDFDSNGNLTIPGGFTGSFASISTLLSVSGDTTMSGSVNVTGSLIVSDASGVFNSSLNVNNSNLTLDNGSNLEIQDNGTLTVNGNGYFNNHVYVTGSTYSDEYRGLTNNNNVLNMDGGSVGAPNVELESSGHISLWAEGGNINLTGSLYTNNNVTIRNGNNLYTNYVYGYDNGDLNLGAWSDVSIYSQNSRNIELRTDNAESGTNYIHVNNDGVDFSTYDFASGLTHKVTLDNTGSLKLDNVSLQLSGSLNVDGNTIFNNNLTVKNDLFVSGNFQVLGTGSIISLTGSQVDFGTNQINLNTYAPFERFAGINVFDSGSNVGVTGSLLWDSQNDVWIYANPSGSNYASARFIAGPKNTGSLGEEQGLTVGHFPIATGDDHISDSLLTYQGTTLALNTNKFTVDSNNGDTLISGNFTIEGVGGVDNGNYTSYIVFRNDENVLGFVDTSDTNNVTDRLLGYNSSTGVLEFSSLIDGGTY